MASSRQTSSRSFETLQKLARIKKIEALSRLTQQQASVAQEQQRLAQLQAYQRDYDGKIQQNTPLSMATFQRYKHFSQNLLTAKDQQQARIEQEVKQVDVLQDQLKVVQCEDKILANVVDRREKIALREDNRAQQKRLDDWVSTRAAIKKG